MTIRERWAALKARLHLIEDCKAEWRKFSTWITGCGSQHTGPACMGPKV